MKLPNKIRNLNRNQVVYGLAAAIFLLFILSLPIEPLNLLTPESTATYIFGMNAQLTDKNTSRVVHLLDGYATVHGKGGLSANNPLTVSITLYFSQNKSEVTFNMREVEVGLHGAYKYPLAYDSRGFPEFAHIPLSKQGDKWTGEGKVMYYAGDVWGGDLRIDGDPQRLPNSIHIGSAEITTSAQTNALFISLTLAFGIFAVLELRTTEMRPREARRNQR